MRGSGQVSPKYTFLDAVRIGMELALARQKCCSCSAEIRKMDLNICVACGEGFCMECARTYSHSCDALNV